jgi:hypothetical protein
MSWHAQRLADAYAIAKPRGAVEHIQCPHALATAPCATSLGTTNQNAKQYSRCSSGSLGRTGAGDRRQPQRHGHCRTRNGMQRRNSFERVADPDSRFGSSALGGLRWRIQPCEVRSSAVRMVS